MKTAFGRLAFFVVFLSSACTTNYRPAQLSPAPSLDRDAAEVAVIKSLKNAGPDDGESYEEVLTGDSQFRFVHKRPYSDASHWSCAYAGTPAPDVFHVTSRPGHDYSTSDLALGGCAIGSNNREKMIIWGGDSNQNADRFADALFILAHSPSPDPAQDPDFQKVVQQHRAVAGRSAVSEEVRAHRVAAEAAVKEKRFEDAVNEYGEALKVAPGWPQGHFNRGLILAEVGAYGAAGREMKRYLLLEPDAENARQVQDKIYEWQAKVK